MLTKNKQNNARLYCNNLKNFDVTIPDSARVRKHSNEGTQEEKFDTAAEERRGEETEMKDCLVAKRKTTESPSKRQREMDVMYSRAISVIKCPPYQM